MHTVKNNHDYCNQSTSFKQISKQMWFSILTQFYYSAMILLMYVKCQLVDMDPGPNQGLTVHVLYYHSVTSALDKLLNPTVLLETRAVRLEMHCFSTST